MFTHAYSLSIYCVQDIPPYGNSAAEILSLGGDISNIQVLLGSNNKPRYEAIKLHAVESNEFSRLIYNGEGLQTGASVTSKQPLWKGNTQQ